MTDSNAPLLLNLAPLEEHANDCGHAFESLGEAEQCTLRAFAAPGRSHSPESRIELGWELNSGTVITLLDQLMAMEGLLPDPHFRGAGHRLLGAQETAIGIPVDLPEYGLKHRLSCLIAIDLPGQAALRLGLDGYSGQPLAAGDAMLLRGVAGKSLSCSVETQDTSGHYAFFISHYYAQN